MKIEYQSLLSPMLEELNKKTNELIEELQDLRVEVEYLRSKLKQEAYPFDDISVYAP